MPEVRAFFPSTRGVSREAAYLIAAGFLINFGGGYFIVARPVYLYQIGFDPTIVGILITVQGLLGVALSIPVAMLSDVVGRKKFVVYGLLLDALGSFLFFYSTSLALLVAAQVVFAFVTAAAGAPFFAFFTETTTNENRNDLFVILGFASGIATSIGSYASGLPPWLGSLLGVNEAAAFRILFLAVAVSSLAAGLIAQVFVLEKNPKVPGGPRISLRGAIKLPRKSIGVVKKFSIVSLTGMGAGMLIPLLPLWYSLKFGVDVSVIGPLYGSIFLMTAIASLFTPALARRKGSIFTIVVPDLAGVVVLLAMPFSPDFLFAGVLMVVRSLLANMYTPIYESFMMSRIDPSERATSSSIIQMFDNIPRAYASGLGGYLFSLGLLDLPFFITGSLYVLSDSLLYLFFGKAESRPPAPQAMTETG
ncbi:MAG: MFS transporter [Nitrososphaerota archaeon]|nr:MFS transporter [Nitrososphaerota archaeon]